MSEAKVNRINHICLIIIAAVALTAGLIYTRSILVLLVFSFFLYTVLSTGIGFINRFIKVHKWVSVSLMMLAIFILTLLLIVMMANSIEDFVSGAKQYQSKFVEFLGWVERQMLAYGITDTNQSLVQKFSTLPIFSYVQGLTAGIFTFFGKVFLVFIMTLFMILGERTGEIQNPFILEMHSKISKYITIKMISSVSTGILVFMILSMFHVELAFMFGTLTFLLNFIPSIGSIIATVLPMPLVFLQYDVSGKTLLIFICLSIVQVIIGNLIEPKLMGERLDLHPVTVLVFLLFWGLVWGIPGMFLAVPITAIVKIILSKMESTEGIAQLLAGRIPE
ncbi:MAG: AI-2E family transporter [Deltaproteobacteria bacterium]|nr:AI-2E family transporter [Deltaproteobacteria bacterium]